MIRVHARQLEAFEASLREAFLARVAAHARRALPELGVGDAALREAVAAAVTRAEVLGLATELDVCAYVDAALLAGAGFDASAWAAPLLEALVGGRPGAHEALLAGALAHATGATPPGGPRG